MGLFGLFGKKNNKHNVQDTVDTSTTPAGEDDLEVYSDMRVEVATLTDELLFAATLLEIHENCAQLQPHIETAPSWKLEPIRVKIRGYSEEDSKAICMEGTVTPSIEKLWQVEDLKLISKSNDRAFFRPRTNMNAIVTLVNNNSFEEDHCKLLNLSVGGVCISSKCEYRKGDTLLLKVQLPSEKELSLFFCRIQRVTERTPAKYEYGCQFMDMSTPEQEKIARVIFDLQRKK